MRHFSSITQGHQKMRGYRHKCAAGIVQSRIKELEMMIDLMEDSGVADLHFIIELKKRLRVNQELYALLVEFTGDNLVH